ncbi:hypothetical protein [Sulfurisoma sediminicola]|uniref:FimV-like protein n=2 Tax=Sulfurisoma sediminicola TaxID=1381557 RepID=A0A497XAW7_9PROT|nr:hypothetical protein [Sulfurisoma sediminicola]RLJ63704.1 hypothetical protein DFR35_2336 [Sulfurisoma sediminicola]
MPRAAGRRKAGGAASPARVLLTACALMLCPPLAAHATTREQPLRLDPALTSPAEDFPPDERALLRVEYQAAQARAAEADVLGDILLRVRNINGMINDIHGIVAAWPIAGAPSAAAPTRSEAVARAAPLQADDDMSATVPEMTVRALMAAVIVFLFWLLGRRHFAERRRLAALAAPSPAATPTVIPEDEAAVALPPPARRSRQTGQEADPGHPLAAAAAVQAQPAVPAPPAAAVAADPAPDQTVVLDALEFELPDIPSPPAAANEASAPNVAAGADQSIELAEIMVSMGLAQGAADALTERIRVNPKRALYHWLKLLEVYRRSQMKEDFERTAQELRQTFNVQPAGWGGATGSFSIEDFPHLSARLQELWPTPACGEFLAHLLEDNRGGQRNGLPQCVAEEILMLEQMLATEAVARAA